MAEHTEYKTRIMLKIDTEENWTARDPILLKGELAIVQTSDGKILIKSGDGKSRYKTLPFAETGTGSLAGLLKGKDGRLAIAKPGEDYVLPTGSITGNAGSANKLNPGRKINGVAFDGTADIASGTLGAVSKVDGGGDSKAFFNTVANVNRTAAPNEMNYYRVYPNSTESMKTADLPVGDGHLLAFNIDDNVKWLRLLVLDVRSNKIFTRVRTDGTWGDWVEVVTSQSGKATVATAAEKLAGRRNIILTGDTTGTMPFDGSQDHSMAVIRRGCAVGQTNGEATALAKPWYKYASINITANHLDRSISFHVWKGYADTSASLGILTAHVRTKTGGVFERAELVWETADSGIKPDDFVLAWQQNGTTVNVELWVKIAVAHTHYHFDVMSEGDRINRTTSLWTLHTASSAGQAAAVTAGYTRITSSLNTIINPISGNAATATKLATGRKINGTLFDGTADITSGTLVTNAMITDKSDFKAYVTTSENIHRTKTDGGELNYYRVHAQNNEGQSSADMPAIDSHVLTFSIDNRNNYIRLLALDIRSNKVYVRAFTNGTTWSDWAELVSTQSGKATAATTADKANQLTTARNFRTNLASTSTASFNGTGDCTPGVTGTLPVANGGTGATTAAAALTALGAAASGHTHNNYLPLAGGNMTGQINTNVNTGTWLNGGKGVACIIRSTAPAVNLKTLFSALTTNGAIQLFAYQGYLGAAYTAKTTIDASTNSTTKAATLLDESGNAKWPGTVTAPTFIGALNGNANTATALKTSRNFQVNLASTTAAGFTGAADCKPGVTGTLPVGNGGTGRTDGKAVALATPRKIGVSGDMVGSDSFDGTADKTPAVTRRGCCVGQSGSSTTNPWYKFASIDVTSTYTDVLITFHVWKAYGDKSASVGILTAHFRSSGTAGAFESGELVWEMANSGIAVGDFVLAYKTDGTTLKVELWTRIAAGYTHYHFDVMSEGIRTARATNKWTLINKSSAGDASAVTAGYTTKTSTLNTIINPVDTCEIGTAQPASGKEFWIDKNNGNLLKYNDNGTWKGVYAVWAP